MLNLNTKIQGRKKWASAQEEEVVVVGVETKSDKILELDEQVVSIRHHCLFVSLPLLS